MTQERQAILLESGLPIDVYKHKPSGNWVNSSDCKTIYTRDQLKFV